MRIKIDTPLQSDTERLDQIIKFYHGKLDDKVHSLRIELQHRVDRQGNVRYFISIDALLTNGTNVMLEENQSDSLMAISRIMNRLLRYIVRQQKVSSLRHLPSMT